MNPDISVVIPVRNEAANVPALYEELTATLESFGRRYEIIVVDDGSTDETFDLLAAVAGRDARLRDHQIPPQFRPDRGILRRVRACARAATS